MFPFFLIIKSYFMNYNSIFKHWNIINPTNIKKMKSFNNKACLIVNYKANKYVLKEKNNIKSINCEYYLLSKLINHNIPVSIPIKTINNSIIKNINLSF